MRPPHDQIADSAALHAAQQPSPWWTPARHADTKPFLAARSAITRSVRAWFEGEGSLLRLKPQSCRFHPEMRRTCMRQPPSLLAPMGAARGAICGPRQSSPARSCWPPARPRFSSLRGCFGTANAAICICPNSPCSNGTGHDANYDAVMADTIVVIAHAAQATGIGQFSFRGRVADPFADPELMTVAAAFERFAGFDLLASVADGSGDRDALAAAAGQRVRISDDDTWSDIFSKVLVEHVEPHLGQGRLTILFEYPAPEAALARVKPGDPRVAERFEVYACGVELANGFGELTDAREQRLRFTRAMDEKQRRYGERYPLDEEFLAAMAVMPQASGVALGFDRHGDVCKRCAQDRSGGLDTACE